MILELESQFLLVITSVILAMVATNAYTFINILFQKLEIIKSACCLCFFFSFTCIYYFCVYCISEGILSIYLPFCLILGYYLHMKFYDKYFSCLYDYLFFKISSIINSVKGRCKKWIGHSLKKMRKKENSIE